MAAHRPQEALGALELAQFGRGQQADVDQIGDRLQAMGVFADPEEGVEVAQAALALLDVGLDQIAALADLAVALVAFGELGLRTGDQVRLNPDPARIHRFDKDGNAIRTLQ